MKRNKIHTIFILHCLTFLMFGPVFSSLSIQSASAEGLKISTINPRYFSDSDGNAVYLTGSHTWNNGQDFEPTIFGYSDYLDFLVAHNHNFIRLWYWEESKMLLDGFNSVIIPNVYARIGPGTANDGLLKFDVTKFNQDFFDRLRSRVIAARERGIYVSIMLFDGWSIVTKDSSNPWTMHPFNRANNINNIDGDQNNNGNGEEIHTLQIPAITRLQEAYIRKVIDTVNDLDNVLYEVSNETDGTSAATQWEYHIINYVKQYESEKPNQHPIGMTAEYPNGSNTDLFNSPADWISPNSSAPSPYNYQNNPPPANGSKVVIADTDHLWGIGGNRVWAWKSFLRGLNVIYMDTYLGNCDPTPADESLRVNMGYIRGYADKIDLLNMTPQSNLSSTGYCLANIGNAYLVYSPSGGTFTVNLASAPDSFSVEWFNPSTGKVTYGDIVSGGVQKSFTSPFSGDAVLYLNHNSIADTTPPKSPSGLTASVISSRQVNLFWTSSADNIWVAGYNVFRNDVQVGTTATTAYQDKNLTPGTVYSYVVSAYDASGNTSSPSREVSVKTPIASGYRRYWGQYLRSFAH